MGGLLAGNGPYVAQCLAEQFDVAGRSPYGQPRPQVRRILPEQIPERGKNLEIFGVDAEDPAARMLERRDGLKGARSLAQFAFRSTNNRLFGTSRSRLAATEALRRRFSAEMAFSEEIARKPQCASSSVLSSRLRRRRACREASNSAEDPGRTPARPRPAR
ncbi:hypothetical protein ACFQX6_45120 [Streptosporangium lutulentum]